MTPHTGPEVPGDAELASEATPRWWRDTRRRHMLVAADLLAAGAATLTLYGEGGAWALALIPVWALIAKMLGLYDRDHRAIRHLTVDEVPYLALWSFGGTTLVALALPLMGSPDLSSARLGEVAAVAFLTVFVFRGGARWLWRELVPPERTTLVGSGELAEITRRKIRLFKDLHLQLTADVASPDLTKLDADELTSFCQDADRVIIAFQRIDPELVGALAVSCRESQTKLSVVSKLKGRALPVPQMTQIADLPVFEFDTWDVPRSTMFLKRCFDFGVALVSLVFLIPLFPLVALAIKLDGRGPVLFSQLRVGIGGKPFRMLKFRTMSAGAEERLAEVVALDELRDPMFKLARDPRVTTVGRVLRRRSLDETPQLLNVLMGQMSIVGPRPEQVELVERYGPEHMFRLQVKPGMTGPMQVHGRGDLTFAERLAVEADYVENITLGRDLKIMVLTLPVVMRGGGAY